MENVERVVSADLATRLFIIVLYAPVIFASYKQLFPRFTPACARLALAFLGAQALTIILALSLLPSTSLDWWLWDLNREFNIASALASTQLAMVGGCALIAAWLARATPAWRRFYLVALAAVFLVLAWDEYYKLHEAMPHWKRYYLLLGLAVALSTIVAAFRSPRRARVWHLCLLAGLAMSGTGAILLEELPLACGSLGFARLDGCLQVDVWEECLEFLGIWLALAAMLGVVSDEAPNPAPRIRRLLTVSPALWLLPLYIYANIPQLERVLWAEPAAVSFDSGLRLHGYHIGSDAETIHIRLYASAKRGIYAGVGYAVQLVDQVSEEPVASVDKPADPFRGFWMLPPGDSPLYRQGIDVAIPPETRSNRAYWITLALWREHDAEREDLSILASDLNLRTETQVILDEIVLPASPVASAPGALALFDNGFSLAGVELPQRARPGETLEIAVAWRSASTSQSDYSQFFHFVHAESGAQWRYEQQPLGARLPTRLWYDGMAENETWEVPLPSDLERGTYFVFSGLYDLSKEERLPASDANGALYQDAMVPLGTIIIASD